MELWEKIGIFPPFSKWPPKGALPKTKLFGNIYILNVDPLRNPKLVSDCFYVLEIWSYGPK